MILAWAKRSAVAQHRAPCDMRHVAADESPSARSGVDVALHESRHRDVPNSRQSSAAFMPTAGNTIIISRCETVTTSSERQGESLPKAQRRTCHAFLPHRTIHTTRSQCHFGNPTTNRQEAARKLIEAAGGKLISMYSVAADGPAFW